MAILAYVDPGTGLLAWQTLVAAVVGTFFYIKKTRDWFLLLLSRVFRLGKPSHNIPEQKALVPQTSDVRRRATAGADPQKSAGLGETPATSSR